MRTSNNKARSQDLEEKPKLPSDEEVEREKEQKMRDKAERLYRATSEELYRDACDLLASERSNYPLHDVSVRVSAIMDMANFVRLRETSTQ